MKKILIAFLLVGMIFPAATFAQTVPTVSLQGQYLSTLNELISLLKIYLSILEGQLATQNMAANGGINVAPNNGPQPLSTSSFQSQSSSTITLGAPAPTETTSTTTGDISTAASTTAQTGSTIGDVFFPGGYLPDGRYAIICPNTDPNATIEEKNALLPAGTICVPYGSTVLLPNPPVASSTQ